VVSRQSAMASAAMIALMAIAGIWALLQLPSDVQIPIHFNASGDADGWARPWFGLFVLPAIALVTWTIQALLPRIDPRGPNLARSATAYGTIWLAVTAVLAVVQAIIIATALGVDFNRGRLFLSLIAGLLIVVGNVMGKLRWNYTVGIRTPWTLADERVWDKTHRLGGRSLVLGGILLLATAFLPLTPVSRGIAVVVIAAGACLTAVVASYVYWRIERRTTG
jgi:uncharacterized membrane protein